MEQGVNKMKERLIKINDELTRIQLSPLQVTDEGLPIELLYASVVIREDQKYVSKRDDSSLYSTRHWKRFVTSCEHTSDFNIGSYRYDQCLITEVTNPDNIFQKDGNCSKRIYMLGDAAHGKTTYCIWLLRKWCNAKIKERTGQKVFDKWEKGMNKFDFMFLMKFRNVDDPNLVSVVDMICQDSFESDIDCHDAIHHVLSSDRFKSLIIMDGLDEWNSNKENRMPKLDVSGSVTCFISMRPWVFPFIYKKQKPSDRIVEIHGLSENGIENVIMNVLINYYKLEKKSQKYQDTIKNILQQLEDKRLKSFIKIPLLAVVCVQIWYEGKRVGDSMSSFYAEMLNMLIERADKKHEIKITHEKMEDCEVPTILSKKLQIKKCIALLSKIGKVAYEGLLSNTTNLEFQKIELEERMGIGLLQFAFDVGLISQNEARSLTTKNVSVHFFHKSVQEFLAAIYIVTNKKVSESFCEHLSNFKIIMELSNVSLFICGLCPSLGSILSQYLVSLTDSKTEIVDYRENPLRNNLTVTDLLQHQVSWYKEFKCGLSDIEMTDRHVTFHVSDVNLDKCSEIETVSLTRKLLSDHHADIRSLRLYNVPIYGEHGITNTALNDFLCNKHNNTTSLVMVYIYGGLTGRSIHQICLPTLKILHIYKLKINTGSVCPLLSDMTSLHELWLWDVALGDGGLGLSDMTSLRKLCLWNVTLGDRGLDLSKVTSLRVLQLHDVTLADSGLDLSGMTLLHELDLRCVSLGDRGEILSTNMVHIEEVRLQSVNMSAAQWQNVIRSAQNIQHRLNVELCNTDIDYKSIEKIRSSSDFRVKWDGKDIFGMYVLYFTRAWPMALVKQ